MIVTNDEDFIHLMSVRGFPPKVVLLKTGNQSTSFIAQTLIRHKQTIEALQSATDIGLLEVFSK